MSKEWLELKIAWYSMWRIIFADLAYSCSRKQFKAEGELIYLEEKENENN